MSGLEEFDDEMVNSFPSAIIDVTSACHGVNCGEAGCIAVNQTDWICLCIDSKPFTHPDEQGHCNSTVSGQVIDPTSMPFDPPAALLPMPAEFPAAKAGANVEMDVILNFDLSGESSMTPLLAVLRGLDSIAVIEKPRKDFQPTASISSAVINDDDAATRINNPLAVPSSVPPRTTTYSSSVGAAPQRGFEQSSAVFESVSSAPETHHLLVAAAVGIGLVIFLLVVALVALVVWFARRDPLELVHGAAGSAARRKRREKNRRRAAGSSGGARASYFDGFNDSGRLPSSGGTGSGATFGGSAASLTGGSGSSSAGTGNGRRSAGSKNSAGNHGFSSAASLIGCSRQDDVFLLQNLTVVSKNPAYYYSDGWDTTVQWASNAGLTVVIDRQSLCLVEEIGEGAFGRVYKGQLGLPNQTQSTFIDVAVKILKDNDDWRQSSIEDFKREVKIVSSFDHDNILRLIAIVPVDDYHPPYMVFEYMEYGDLAALLQANDPCSGVTPKVKLTERDQIDMAAQIASGMKYLASRRFVHRDLATRNCLVGSRLTVKIADFGMSRDVYTCDYYKVGGNRLLPVRWMSLETIRYGRYTTESDVWAFGVVLWEIFSNGRQPYYGHSNEEVIQFLEDGILLQKPSGCPDVIYHVMLGCWRRDPRERFSFERIHRHLTESTDSTASALVGASAALVADSDAEQVSQPGVSGETAANNSLLSGSGFVVVPLPPSRKLRIVSVTSELARRPLPSPGLTLETTSEESDTVAVLVSASET